MSYVNPNAATEYMDRQDRLEERIAYRLSRENGRAVDSFGFVDRAPRAAHVEMPHGFVGKTSTPLRIPPPAEPLDTSVDVPSIHDLQTIAEQFPETYQKLFGGR